MESFLDHYSVVQADATIRPTFENVVKLRGYVSDLETAARRERETTERIAILRREQKLPVSQRSPFAHPSVLAENLQANIDGHVTAAKECDVFLAKAKNMMAQLQVASAP